MRKILWLTFIFTLLFVSHSFAAYSFSAKKDGTTITATLSGIPNSDTYKLVAQTTPIETGDTYTGKIPGESEYLIDPTVKKAVLGKANTTSVTWVLGGNKANTTYYLRVADVTQKSTVVLPVYIAPTVTITTVDATIPLIPLTTEKDGTDIIIKGKIDTTKIANFIPSSYVPRLMYTKTVPASGATSLPDGTGPINSRKTSAADGPEGVNADGTYFWRLTSLSPSTTYYIQQTVSEDNVNSKVDTIANFNSSTGNIVTSTASQADYNNSHSYTLLSGFPNFTVLPDPDLCAQQRASGLNPQFCDMNDVINYFLKLMIGLAAVMLVFRLMFEGYQYMTTDVPFLKASSKGAFFAALGGLLLALSSYIILNTINPKLVDNTIGVNQLSISIDDDYDAIPLTGAPTGTVPTGKVAKCTEGITSFSTAGGTFWACKSIATQFTSLMAAAHAAGLNLKGGGFRTAAEQIDLRRQHCGAANIYVAAAKCSPITALPGNSNHESGLAFDLTCDGTLIQGQDNKCFVWLKANAGKYGLKNFAKEPWHWSTDGK